MSNTTNITNEPYLTECLYFEYFKYQIITESRSTQGYSINVKTNNASVISEDVVKFCNSLDPLIPVIVIGIDCRGYNVNENIKICNAYELPSYQIRTIKNPIIIADNSTYYGSVRWDKQRFNAVREMNPRMIITIN